MLKLLQPLLAEFPAARRWVVAYSGGLDSHVLLHLCAAFRSAQVDDPPALVALHVNHGVQAQAEDWALHCEQVCTALKIPLQVRAAGLDAVAGEAISEDALRVARYRVFEEFCAPDDVLLLAHHQDDQAETVLLRLSRGAGVTGLSGMPRVRRCGEAQLCRPLLELSRRSLRGYAEAHGLHWIEDPSNLSSDAAARNYLRSEVLPLLDARWPGVSERITRAAQHCAQAADICSELAQQDLLDGTTRDSFGQSVLALEYWRALPRARARNLLRAWISSRCGVVIATQTTQIVEQEIIGAGADAQPELRVGEHRVRRFRDHLYVLAWQPDTQTRPADFVVYPGFDGVIPGVGRIVLQAQTGVGVRAGSLHEIRFRSADVICKMAGRPHKTLKKLLQELDVPPWLRNTLPLLYVDGHLTAVAHLCICEGFEAMPGEPAVTILWEPVLNRDDTMANGNTKR